jgi:hypothetical protein
MSRFDLSQYEKHLDDFCIEPHIWALQRLSYYPPTLDYHVGETRVYFFLFSRRALSSLSGFFKL